MVLVTRSDLSEKGDGRIVEERRFAVTHDPSAPTSSSLLIQMKEEILQLLMGSSRPSREPVMEKPALRTDKLTPETEEPTPETEEPTPETDILTPETDKPTPETDKPTPETYNPASEQEHGAGTETYRMEPGEALERLEKLETCILHRSDVTPLGIHGIGAVRLVECTFCLDPFSPKSQTSNERGNRRTGQQEKFILFGRQPADA